MSNDFVKKGYNKVADNYLVGRDKFKNNKYLDKFNDLIPADSTILDIGCGAGVPIDQYLINKGHKIIGIDISERQIELAKENVPQGEYRVEDMSDLEEKEYEVDALVSFYAIFHTLRSSHQEIFNKINSFLKKDGYILITMGAREWEGKEEFFGGEVFWSHFGAKTNRELVEKAGFKIIMDEIDDTGDEKHQVIIAQKK